MSVDRLGLDRGEEQSLGEDLRAELAMACGSDIQGTPTGILQQLLQAEGPLVGRIYKDGGVEISFDLGKISYMAEFHYDDKEGWQLGLSRSKVEDN